MKNRIIDAPRNEAVELGNLLANTIASVVSAQEQLDLYTENRRRAFEQSEDGEFALPPVWYLFKHVRLDLELSGSVARVRPANQPDKAAQPHLVARTLNPSMVSLYGYQASSGLRVSVDIEPQGFVPLKESDSAPSDQE